METRIEIVIALLLAATGVSHTLRPRVWIEFFQMLGAKRDAGVFVIAMMHLPLGALILAFHNGWSGWPIIVTVIGWAWFLKGALYLTFPGIGMFALRRLSIERTYEFRIGGLVLIALAGLICVSLLRNAIG